MQFENPMAFSLATIFESLIRFVGKTCNKLESQAEGGVQKRILWALVIVLCFGIILFLNVLTPMIADDFGYLYVFGEKVQVSSLSDIIRSQKNHYIWWGGRSVVHFIAQALLQMPAYMADILNSGVYMLFVALIYFHIRGRDKRHSLSLFVLINLAIWFLVPMFGDTILWITGSANYLWGTAIVLLFLLPYRLYDGERRRDTLTKQVLMSALMLIFGVFAGWTNENTVAGLIVIICLLLFYYRSQGWKIPPALMLGLVGVIIGYAIMILAPGNFFRGRHAPELSFYLLLYRIFTYTQTLFLNYGIFITLYLVLVLWFRKKKSKEQKTITHLSLIYVIGTITAIYVMIFSPQFPLRAWFGIVTYLLIALGIIFYNLNYRSLLAKQVRASLILVGSIAFLFSLILAIKDICRIQQIDKERVVIAKAAVAAGEEVCYFKQFIPHTTYVHGEDAESNMLLSYYYGIFVEYERE